MDFRIMDLKLESNISYGEGVIVIYSGEFSSPWLWLVVQVQKNVVSDTYVILLFYM